MGVAARAPPRNALSPAAIAGVVLGTVAVVALLAIAGVLIYFIFQRRAAKRPRVRKRSKTDITPFPSDISFSESHASRNSQQDGRANGGSFGSRTGLLDAGSNPASPDWRTTMPTTPDTNTFAGGTTDHPSSSSHGHYRTEIDSSASLINLDSPPPYVVPHSNSSPPVPLVPLRKNRRLLDS